MKNFFQFCFKWAKVLCPLSILVITSCRTMDIQSLDTTNLDLETVDNYDKSLANPVNNRVAVRLSSLCLNPKSGNTATINSFLPLFYTIFLQHANTMQGIEVLNIIKLTEKKSLPVTNSPLSSVIADQFRYMVEPCLADLRVAEVYHPPHTEARPVYDKDGRVTAYTYITYPESWSYSIGPVINITITDEDDKTIVYNRKINKYVFAFSSSKKFHFLEKNREKLAFYMENVFSTNLETIKSDIHRRFPVTTMIIALRGSKKAGMIPVGAVNNIRPGDIFKIIYNKEEIGQLRIFHVDQTSSWGKITHGRYQVKTGMTALLLPEKKSFIKRLLNR